MDFFQEPTFTAFLALILTFIVAKIVSFAVSNSTTSGNNGVCSVNEGAVAKEVTVDRGLRVRRSKGQKRVKFVDDVVIRRIDRYEGSENLVLSDDFGSVGEVILEKNGERVDQENEISEDSGERESEEQCLDVREMSDAKGSARVEMLIEKEGDDDNMDRVGLKSAIREEQKKIEVELGSGTDTMTEEKEGNGGMSTGESEGLFAGDKEEEEGEKRDERDDDDNDDDWEGIERSELEKVFAEAVNYVEYGGKGKDKEDDHLAKLSSDVQMELYGLHKVAVEGPCTEPSPMALKVSARAKWNSWQRMGSMNREAAMEQYIRVLSDSIPTWMHDYSVEDAVERKLEIVGKIAAAEHGRELGSSATPIGDSTASRTPVEKDDAISDGEESNAASFPVASLGKTLHMVTLNQYIISYMF